MSRAIARIRHVGRAAWLQIVSLGLAVAISFLGALLGLGFGLVQFLTHPEPSASPPTAASQEQGATMVAASVANMQAIPLTTLAAPPVREIQATARVIEPNYTVEAGDTLNRIAIRYNTTVERIQAFNSQITDPRSLRIGSKLVIPPAL